MSVSFYIGLGGEDDLNVSNANFADIMRTLGYEPVSCGELDGSALAAFGQRIGEAQALLRAVPDIDASVAPTHSGGPGTGQCRMIVGGRDAGYLTMRLGQLQELVQIAQAGKHALRWA